ncbi:MAG: hypothetical protein MUE54_01610 [Anaerolineae bacterium]|jgi:hypothetical protein|nr:hypothetical protein [Anaerolineae bacterium]
MPDDALNVTVTEKSPEVVQTRLPTVNLTIQDIHLSLPYPQDWETYTTEYGIVLAEYLGSVATEGQLGGILVHLFIPPLDGFDLPIANETNRALIILREILTHPDYVGDATVSEPYPFMWGEWESAYYLMDNGEGNLTIVIGILDPSINKLVTVSVSAPAEDEARIRPSLATLLNNLVINNHALSGDVLERVLPNPLVFPRHQPAS